MASNHGRGATLVAAICALTCANASAATTFVVDKTADDAGGGACTAAPNDCSLRSAIKQANAVGGADTITLDAATYDVTNSMEPITTDVTLTGAGARATAIDGGGVATPLLSVNSSSAVVSVSDLTVQRAGIGSFDGTVSVGDASSVTLSRLALVNNASPGLTMSGGSVLLRSSVVAHNAAPIAGGIINSGGGSGLLVISDSTIAQNTALPSSPEQPLAFTGGIIVTGIASIVDSTIAGNRVDPSANAFGADNLAAIGGGTAIGAIQISNSIVAEASFNGNCSGDVRTGGHNLDSDGTCGFHAISDHPGVDPLLAALADNGGPTDTRALAANSPAVDAGAGCAATDQRGIARPAGGACDIGAFESPFTAAAPVTPPPVTPVTTPGDTTPAKLTVGGIGKTVKRKAFNKGLKVKIGANEPIAAELTLLATPRKVTIAKLPSIALATKSLPRAGGTRTVTLKPLTKIKGKRSVKMRLTVVAFDAAGNRSSKTVAFTVK